MFTTEHRNDHEQTDYTAKGRGGRQTDLTLSYLPPIFSQAVGEGAEAHCMSDPGILHCILLRLQKHM